MVFSTNNFKISSLLFIILFINFSYSQNPLSKASSYSHLFDVNKQWSKYKDISPNEDVEFQDEKERINFHLKNVIKNLRTKAFKNFTFEERQNRNALLNSLEKYAEKKEFPTNSFHTKRTPYFIDVNGVHCAVGYLMKESGSEDLAIKISEEFNFSLVADIKTDGVGEWAKENGFTLDELKWIQPTYGLGISYKSLLNGANGVINKSLTVRFPEHRVAYIGDFDKLNNLPCLNIGYYNGENLSCYGSGIEGKVNDISTADRLYAGGSLLKDGINYSVAEFVNNDWNFMNIPGKEGAEVTSIYAKMYWYKGSYFAIKDPINPNYSEIWNLHGEDSWYKVARVKGIVLNIDYFEDHFVFAGHFDTVFIESTNDTIICNNVILNNFINLEWYSIGSQVSDTIYDLEIVNERVIYFGGTCTDSNDVCMSRYLNNDIQPLLLRSHFGGTEKACIKDIYFKGNSFYLAGKFNIVPYFVGERGSNFGTFNVLSNEISPLSTLNNTVNTISFFNNEEILGGSFTKDNLSSNISFLAKIKDIENPIKELEQLTLILSPNPFSNEIEIIGEKNDYIFYIYNSNAELILKGITENNKISNLEFLPKEIYFIKLSLDNIEFVQRVIKK